MDHTHVAFADVDAFHIILVPPPDFARRLAERFRMIDRHFANLVVAAAEDRVRTVANHQLRRRVLNYVEAVDLRSLNLADAVDLDDEAILCGHLLSLTIRISNFEFRNLLLLQHAQTLKQRTLSMLKTTRPAAETM